MAGKRDQSNREDKKVVLVLGIGNPILTDDAVGLLVVQNLGDVKAEVKEAAVGGISLLDHILGYSTVIIVDAVKKGDPPGTVSLLQEDEIKRAIHASSTHDVSFSEALQIGRNLFPQEMPSLIVFVGIEVQETETFSEMPTEPVQKAIPEAISLVRSLVDTYRLRP